MTLIIRPSVVKRTDRPVSMEEIEAKRTERGGWTQKQLAIWVIPWPPPKGWKKALAARGRRGKSTHAPNVMSVPKKPVNGSYVAQNSLLRSALPDRLQQYAERRVLDCNRFSRYHMRIDDGGYIEVDVWTTGKYHIRKTDYRTMMGKSYIERNNETGTLPLDHLEAYLDKIFFPET